MTDVQERDGTPTRRGVLLGAGALSAGAIVTACGGNQPSSEPTSGASVNATTSMQASATTTSTQASEAVKASDVPVGGGTVFKEQNTVVTQPQAAQFKAFSATCTHQGCIVSSVSDGTINCPCHGSQFNMADGSVVTGPATVPLPAKTVTVTGDTLTIT